MLTIFSAPKPFVGHIDLIQRNAIGSWIALGPDVEVILIGDEIGLTETAAEFDLVHIPQVQRNELGTPLLNSIFSSANEAASTPNLCYVNADILLMDDLLPTLKRVVDHFSKFLLIGQRWDLEVLQALAFENGWQSRMRSQIKDQGDLHPPAGSDYFVYPKGVFDDLPEFALGRAGWDNWMIYAARSKTIPVIDASKKITIIHQNHGYEHLPDGKPHYRLPETKKNVRLAGGKETIFTLLDANWTLTEQGIQRRTWKERLQRRAIEASIIAKFGPGAVTRIAGFILHPIQRIQYLLSTLKYKIISRDQPEDGQLGN
jgi:hypothetical protein